MTRLRLPLGDQLNANHSWFGVRDDTVLYVMMEVRSETDYVRHHAQKVLAIFAAMRAFAAALEQAGHQVLYLRIGDPRNQQDFAANLAWLIDEHEVDALGRIEADEWRVEEALSAAFNATGFPTEVVDAEHFLLPRAELSKRFGSKVPRMEYFYRDLRRQHHILLEADGKPRGGQWNLDHENRAKWKGSPSAPTWPAPAHDLRALWQEIVDAGVKTMGEASAEAFGWPLSRREARGWLNNFIEHRLVHFGQFQDAISEQSATLFHSGLSFALNTKMLHPREVIDAAIEAYEDGDAPLAAVEGFVRQILGWREFMRGVYWACRDIAT